MLQRGLLPSHLSFLLRHIMHARRFGLGTSALLGGCAAAAAGTAGVESPLAFSWRPSLLVPPSCTVTVSATSSPSFMAVSTSRSEVDIVSQGRTTGGNGATDPAEQRTQRSTRRGLIGGYFERGDGGDGVPACRYSRPAWVVDCGLQTAADGGGRNGCWSGVGWSSVGVVVVVVVLDAPRPEFTMSMAVVAKGLGGRRVSSRP